jgi:hypothetical protein
LFQAIRLSVECGCSLNDMMVNQVWQGGLCSWQPFISFQGM